MLVVMETTSLKPFHTNCLVLEIVIKMVANRSYFFPKKSHLFLHVFHCARYPNHS